MLSYREPLLRLRAKRDMQTRQELTEEDVNLLTSARPYARLSSANKAAVVPEGPKLATLDWAPPEQRYSLTTRALRELVRFNVKGYSSFRISARCVDSIVGNTDDTSSVARFFVSCEQGGVEIPYVMAEIGTEALNSGRWIINDVCDHLILRAGLTNSVITDTTRAVNLFVTLAVQS